MTVGDLVIYLACFLLGGLTEMLLREISSRRAVRFMYPQIGRVVRLNVDERTAVYAGSVMDAERIRRTIEQARRRGIA